MATSRLTIRETGLPDVVSGFPGVVTGLSGVARDFPSVGLDAPGLGNDLSVVAHDFLSDVANILGHLTDFSSVRNGARGAVMLLLAEK